MEPRTGQPQEREPFDGTCEFAETAASVSDQLMRNAPAAAWADALAREINERRRAECMARIQSDAVKLALDLLVREPDITGFFRVFIKTLVEECESHACGVWLLERRRARCAGVQTCGWRTSRSDSSRGALPAGNRWRCRARACRRISSPTSPAGPRSSTTKETIRACRSPCGPSTSRTASTRSSSRRSCCRPATSAGSRCRPAGRRSAMAPGIERCSTQWRARRRWRCTKASSPNRAVPKRVDRRCSKSATGWPATSTTRWRRASLPS